MTKERRQPPHLTLDHIAATAKEILLLNGRHVPTVIVEGSQQLLIVQIPALAPTHEGRVRQMLAAGATVAREGQAGRIRRVFFISEAWMVSSESGSAMDVSPSEDPRRIEALVIVGLDARSDRATMAMVEMIRDDQGNLIELKDIRHPEHETAEADAPLLEAFAHGVRMLRPRA